MTWTNEKFNTVTGPVGIQGVQFTPTGWICPKCQAGVNPAWATCPCANFTVTNTAGVALRDAITGEPIDPADWKGTTGG